MPISSLPQFREGTSSQISQCPVTNGTMYFNLDTGEVAYDLQGKRFTLHNIQSVETAAQLPESGSGSIYIAKDTGHLHIFTTEWLDFTPSGSESEPTPTDPIVYFNVNSNAYNTATKTLTYSGTRIPLYVIDELGSNRSFYDTDIRFSSDSTSIDLSRMLAERGISEIIDTWGIVFSVAYPIVDSTPGESDSNDGAIDTKNFVDITSIGQDGIISISTDMIPQLIETSNNVIIPIVGTDLIRTGNVWEISVAPYLAYANLAEFTGTWRVWGYKVNNPVSADRTGYTEISTLQDRCLVLPITNIPMIIETSNGVTIPVDKTGLRREGEYWYISVDPYLAYANLSEFEGTWRIWG